MGETENLNNDFAGEKIQGVVHVLHERPPGLRIGYTVKEKQSSYGRKSKGKGGVKT